MKKACTYIDILVISHCEKELVLLLKDYLSSRSILWKSFSSLFSAHHDYLLELLIFAHPLGKKNLGSSSCCKTDLITNPPRAPQHESPLPVWVTRSQSMCTGWTHVCEELNSHSQSDPAARPRPQQCLSNPSWTAVTAEPWGQEHHPCWTSSLLTASTVTHGLLHNLPLQASAHTVCLVFPLFFCWGRQESSFLSCLIQQLCNNPNSQTTEAQCTALVYGVYFIKTS